ncbi:MAG TPA: hypothetical protein VI277_03910 [Candidatus Limnocylindria bacterium]
MKNRWIGGLVLAMAVALGACAPPGQGGGSSDEPPESTAPESIAPASTAAEPSTAPSQPAPSYDYDY